MQRANGVSNLAVTETSTTVVSTDSTKTTQESDNKIATVEKVVTKSSQTEIQDGIYGPHGATVSAFTKSASSPTSSPKKSAPSPYGYCKI